MTDANGWGPDLSDIPRYTLDPDELSPQDLKRARVALDGKDPWALLNDPDTMFPLVIWCLVTRHRPEFTFEEAERTSFKWFKMPAAPKVPPTPGAELNGSSSAAAGRKKTGSSRRKPGSTSPTPASAETSTPR